MPDVTITRDPKVVDLSLYQGDDFEQSFRFGTEDEPYNLTGFVPQAQIRKKPGSTGSPLATFICTVPTPTDGLVLIRLVAAASALLPKTCAWDLQLVDPNGDTKTYIKGAVAVGREVTK